ncbi:hypothetical protein AC1031_009518 [Aphanomyces cochlioides]|nr:hypothetical protein AC1031_009518 [Aphanomyces cochlioides]
MTPRESSAMRGHFAAVPNPSAEISIDIDAPSNSTLGFEPAEFLPFALDRSTPTKAFQILTVVNLHPLHTTFFSVKTLKPERYFIKPSKVMLGPRERVNVRIELRQTLYDEVLPHLTVDNRVVTDRLLIQSGFNTNPAYNAVFQNALRFKDEMKSKEKDAAWSAAWKTIPSAQIHSKNLIMRFAPATSLSHPLFPSSAGASTHTRSAKPSRQMSVESIPPLFTTQETTFSIEENPIDSGIPAHVRAAAAAMPIDDKPVHVLPPGAAPAPISAPTPRKTSTARREKSGLNLALVPSTESLVFAISPNKDTTYSTIHIENLASMQRVVFTVRIESKFRCKAVPFRVGWIDANSSATIQLELAMSLHQEIVHQLRQGDDIQQYKVRLQVMELEPETHATLVALPTIDNQVQYLKDLWHDNPSKRMFVQKYVTSFVLEKPQHFNAVRPSVDIDEVEDDELQGRQSQVSECASFATAFTRAPPMRPIMTPLEHLEYQRSLNQHLIGGASTSSAIRPTLYDDFETLHEQDHESSTTSGHNGAAARATEVHHQPDPEPPVVLHVVSAPPPIVNVPAARSTPSSPVAPPPVSPVAAVHRPVSPVVATPPTSSSSTVPATSSMEARPSLVTPVVAIPPPSSSSTSTSAPVDVTASLSVAPVVAVPPVAATSPKAIVETVVLPVAATSPRKSNASTPAPTEDEVPVDVGTASTRSLPSDATLDSFRSRDDDQRPSEIGHAAMVSSSSSASMPYFGGNFGGIATSILTPIEESRESAAGTTPSSSFIEVVPPPQPVAPVAPATPVAPVVTVLPAVINEGPSTPPPQHHATIDDETTGFSILTFPEDATTSARASRVPMPTTPPPLPESAQYPEPEPVAPAPAAAATPSKSRFSLLKAFERNYGPSVPTGLITLTPQTILYHLDVGSQPTGKVTLHNHTSTMVVYKIKSAQPQRYKVKPSQGFLEPLAQCDVDIDLHSAAYDDLMCLSKLELGDIRDCLLVETTKVANAKNANALRGAATGTDLLAMLKAVWTGVDKKQVNASRLFCEFAFDDSNYQSFTSMDNSTGGGAAPAVELVEGHHGPSTPPPSTIEESPSGTPPETTSGFGWHRSKSDKVLRNKF